MADVRKELSFCAKTKLRVLGVVENMSKLHVPFESLGLLDAGGADVTEAARAALRAAGIDTAALTSEAPIFRATRGGADEMGRAMDVEVLGRIPLDPLLCLAAESGKSFVRDIRSSKDPHAQHSAHGTTIRALRSVVENVVRRVPPMPPQPPGES